MKTKSRLLRAYYTPEIMPEKLQLSKFIGCVEHKFSPTIIFNENKNVLLAICC